LKVNRLIEQLCTITAKPSASAGRLRFLGRGGRISWRFLRAAAALAPLL
jgi:hypothetical protein